MLPPLIAFLTANISQFKAKMGEAVVVAEATTSKTSGIFNTLAGAGKIAFLATAATAALAGGVIFELAKHAEDAGQAAYEMAEKTGLAKQQASAWLAVGQAVGVQGGQLLVGFRFLSRSMENINLALQSGHKPSAALVQVYHDLGVKIYDTHGKLRSLNDVMLDVADRFSKMPDGPEKTALAMRLFGRSGADLIPILNEGRTGIAAFMAKAQQSGAIMSGPQVDAAHAAYLAHKQFDQAVTGLETSLSVGLLPIMSQVFGWLTSTGVPAVRSMIGWMQQHTQIVKIVAAAIGGVLVVAIAAYTVAMVAAAVATIAATWPILLIIAAAAALGAGIYLLVTHWKQVTAFINREWRAATSFVGATFSHLGTTIHNFFASILARAQAAWKEFSSRPIYWIGFAIGWIASKMIQLQVQFGTWLGGIIVRVGIWALQLGGKAIQAAIAFQHAMDKELPKLPGQIWNLLVRVIGQVARWQIQFSQKARDAAISFGKAMWNELSKEPGRLVSIGAALIKGLVSGFSAGGGFGPKITTMFNQASNTITGWLNQLPGLVQNGIIALTGFVLSQLSSLGNQITGGFNTAKTSLVNGVVGLFTQVTAPLHRTFDQIVKTAEDAWKVFSQRPIYWLTRLVLMVPLALAKLAVDGLMWIRRFSISVGETIGRFVRDAISYVQQLPGRILEFLSETATNVVNMTDAIITTGIRLGLQFVQAIISYIRALPGRAWNIFFQLLTFVGRLERQVVAIVIRLASAMLIQGLALARNFWRAITTELWNLPGQVWNIFLGVLGFVTQLGGEALKAGIKLATDFTTAVWKQISTLPGAIWSWLLQALDKVRDFGVNLGKAAAIAATQLWDNFTSALANFPSQLFSLGQSLLQAVINGILSLASSVKSAFGQVIQGAIDQTKATFGVHSPADATLPIGTSLGQGVAVSLLGQAETVALAMKNVIQAAVGQGTGQVGSLPPSLTGPPATAGVPFGGLPGGGGQQPTFIVNYNGPVATEMVANKVVKRLADQARRKGLLQAQGIG